MTNDQIIADIAKTIYGEDAVMEMLHDNEWYDYDYYWNTYCEYYETFEDTTTTPSGDRVVAFGYYGHD